MSTGMREEFRVRGRQLVDKVNDLVREGNVRRVIVKNDRGERVMELPLSIGVVGVVAAPLVAAVGAIAGLAARWRVEVERREPTEPPATTDG